MTSFFDFNRMNPVRSTASNGMNKTKLLLSIFSLFVLSAFSLFVWQNEKVTAQTPPGGIQTNFSVTTGMTVNGTALSRNDTVNVGVSNFTVTLGGKWEDTTNGTTFASFSNIVTIQSSDAGGNVKSGNNVSVTSTKDTTDVKFIPNVGVSTLLGPGGSALESVTWVCTDGSSATDASISPGNPSEAPGDNCDATLNYVYDDSDETSAPPASPGINHAQFISYTNIFDGAIMQTNETRNVTVTMRNDGTTTWTADSYSLHSHNPMNNTTWGPWKIGLSAASGPLNYNTSGPTHLLGVFSHLENSLQYQISEVEVYDTSGNKININGCYFIDGSGNTVSDTCAKAYDGDYATSITTNAGMLLGWDIRLVVGLGYVDIGTIKLYYPDSGSSPYITLRDMEGGKQQSPGYFAVINTAVTGYDDMGSYILVEKGASDIAQTQNAPFSFNITAPNIPGIYPFQWRMHQDGVEDFDNSSDLIFIEVVNPSGITADLKINGSDSAAYYAGYSPITLSWTTTGNPSSCTLTDYGSVPSSGSRDISALSASAGTKNYQLTCSKAGVPNAVDTAELVINQNLFDCRTLITPASNGHELNLTPTSYTAAWDLGAPSSAIGSYRFRGAPNTAVGIAAADSGCPGFPGGACVAASGVINAPTATYNLSGLTANTDYYNRVAALCAVPNTNGLPSYVDYTWVTNTSLSAVSGVCGPAATTYSASDFAFSGDYCNTGSASPASPSFPSIGVPSNWTCLGSGGGGDDYCTATKTAAPVNGTCGPASTNYSSSASSFTGDLCSTGDASPASPSFPAPGGSSNWTCLGLNGGSNSLACTATRDAAGPDATAHLRATGGGQDSDSPADGSITVPSGTDVTLYWEYDDASSCRIDPAIVNLLAESYPTDSGNVVIDDITTPDKNYYIYCDPPFGSPYKDTVEIKVTAPPAGPFNLVLTKGGNGTVISQSNPTQNEQINCGLSCNGDNKSFPQGSIVTLTATPNSGRIFVGWDNEDCVVGDNATKSSSGGTCVLTMNENKSVIAIFTIDPNFKEF